MDFVLLLHKFVYCLVTKALFGCICIHFNPHILEWIGMKLV